MGYAVTAIACAGERRETTLDEWVRETMIPRRRARAFNRTDFYRPAKVPMALFTPVSMALFAPGPGANSLPPSTAKK